MTVAQLRESAEAYDTMIAEWSEQRDALQREADAINQDISELRTYRANIVALASIQEGRRRYAKQRRTGNQKG